MSEEKKQEQEAPDVLEEAVEGSVDEAVDETEEPTPEEALAAERDEFRDKWLRAVAEQDNLRKRTRREVTEARTFATADVLRDVAEVLDDFERALAADAAAENEAEGHAAFRTGVELIESRLRDALQRRGLERMNVEKGDEFDPRSHEAVAQVPGGDVESGAVLEVIQAGYVLGEMVLRPARVVVAQ